MECVPSLERKGRGGLDQVGGGDIFGSTDDEGSEDEEDVEKDAEDDEDADEEDDDDEEEDEVFRFIRKLARRKLNNEGVNNPSHKRFQKTFRHTFFEYLLWAQKLHKTPTYKKIMETVRELQNGSPKYDKTEALAEAIRRRKFILNRLVPESTTTDESMSGDDNDTDDEQTDTESV